MVTTATDGSGVPELLDALDAHRAQSAADPEAPARYARAEAEVWSILGERVRALATRGALRAETDALIRRVARHEVDPIATADQVLWVVIRNSTSSLGFDHGD